jgi:galactoside O-acetyltransferase
LKNCGKEVRIYPTAKIVKPEVIEIGDHTVIDDYTFINGGNGITLGRYIHVASFTSIIGGGSLEVGDYAVLACGSRVLTGTDTYTGGSRMSTSLPLEQRNPIIGKVVIEKDAFVGTNVVIHPNVTIGEGAIIGSNSLVIHDVPPYTINTGSPCKIQGKRPRVTRAEI